MTDRRAEPNPPRTGAVGEEGLAEQHYRLLRRQLVSGAYHPGQALSEASLSAATGVSRTPIREALRLLAHDGFLERDARSYRVRRASDETIIELYDARIALESVVVASAAFRRSDLDLRRLAYTQDLLAEAGPADAGAVTELFHQALWAASGNETATGLLGTLTDIVQLFEQDALDKETNVQATLEEHGRILEALEARDAPAAQAALAAHLGRTRDLRVGYFARRAATLQDEPHDPLDAG